ncbi:Uncharacterized protein JA1_004782 [Spathaspora sp. JA1]|nr:Uncharacterized protein JA1_004782 [Spathaspora sp. JA1]
MAEDPKLVKFKIKHINWSLDYNDSGDRISTPIILQDKNGPCPLIALINTLLLTNDLQLNHHTDSIHIQIDQTKSDAILHFKSVLLQHFHQSVSIDLEVLLKHVGDLLLAFTDEQEDITPLLSSLPLLHTGLTVNPNLITGDFNQEDLATKLFTLFDLKFKHGWVINQIENENAEWSEELAITSSNSNNSGGASTDDYSQLVEFFNRLETFDKIQDYLLLDAAHSTQETTIKHNQQLISKWLDLNRTQLTKIGLTKLNIGLNNQEFVIFFRNNHFSTLFKKSNNEFYILITDTSFQSKNSCKIIWQSLNSISGNDDLFFTGDFLPVLDIDQDLRHPEEDVSVDYLLTKQLQEQEDEELAKRMQKTYDKRSQQPQPKKPPPAAKAATKDEKKKKKKTCTIV